MKTLAKLIIRLIFGPSIEDYEARQRAETVKALKRIHTAYPVSKIPQATARLWGADKVRAMGLSELLQIQVEAQLQAIERTKRKANAR